ncbi:MAG: hypothetical protein KC592_05345 [Nitrospira sp.]|nr:hypothetical protein [Nitrospira sp.]
MAAIPLNEIELATLMPGAELVKGQGVEETWISDIYAESGPTTAYVKVLNPNQIISEVVCAMVGLALNLNIPKPFLVQVDKPNLPHSIKWIPGENRKFCFGSENANSQSFSQLITRHQNKRDAFLTILFNWPGFKETAWFDEWVANGDRHAGNILWNGKTFWLIDHSHALTGQNWVPTDLKNGKKVLNKFLDAGFVSRMNQATKEEWSNLAGTVASRYVDVELANLNSCGMMEEYATNEEIEAVVRFLETRAKDFLKLACERLQLPAPLL